MKKDIILYLGDFDEEAFPTLEKEMPATLVLGKDEAQLSSAQGILFFGGDQVGERLASVLSSPVPLVSLGRSDRFPSVVFSFQGALESLPLANTTLAVPSSCFFMEIREWCRANGVPMDPKGISILTLLKLPYRKLLKEGIRLLLQLSSGEIVQDMALDVEIEKCPIEKEKYIVCSRELQNRLSFDGFVSEENARDYPPSLLVTTSLEEALARDKELVLLFAPSISEEVMQKRHILVAPEYLWVEEGFHKRIQAYMEKGKLPSFAASALAKKTMARMLSLSYGDKLTKEDLATSLGVSSDYLERAFQKTYGIKLWDLVQQWRIAGALHFLQEGKSIQESAKRAGFSSQSYFSRIFRKCRGLTVREHLSKQKTNS